MKKSPFFSFFFWGGGVWCEILVIACLKGNSQPNTLKYTLSKATLTCMKVSCFNQYFFLGYKKHHSKILPLKCLSRQIFPNKWFIKLMWLSSKWEGKSGRNNLMYTMAWHFACFGKKKLGARSIIAKYDFSQLLNQQLAKQNTIISVMPSQSFLVAWYIPSCCSSRYGTFKTSLNMQAETFHNVTQRF